MASRGFLEEPSAEEGFYAVDDPASSNFYVALFRVFKLFIAQFCYLFSFYLPLCLSQHQQLLRQEQ